jgi:hypothetical protein
MAFESTAINDLVAGLQQKPLARESDDWLFGEGDDATQIDPRAGQLAPEFDAMRAVELPRPFAQMRVPMASEPARHVSPTTHVHTFDWVAVAKKLVLPTMLISVVSVAFGIYFAVTDETPRAKPVAAAVADDKPTAVEAPAAAPAPAPVAKPVEEAVESVEMKAVVTPIEEPIEEPIDEPQPQAQPEPQPPTIEAKVEVPPDSPAGRFLAPAPVETTIKKIEKPSPAPTTVADLAPAPKAAAVEKPVKVAKAAPAKREAKSVARKKNVRASKARTAQKTVAAAPEPDVKAEAKPAVVSGKGILSIASTPSMEVWVDGRNSNAMTPVRIKLMAGRHKVTLFDKQNAKARSFEIEIKPDETTTVSKSYQ